MTPDRGSPLSRLLAKNMAYNFVGAIVPAFFALALLPVLTRGMGAEAFGILALSWLVFTYLTDIGLGRAVTKFVADAAARDDGRALPAVVATSVTVQSLAGLALGGALALAVWLGADALVVVPPELRAETRVSFMLVAAAVPFVLLASAYRGVLEAAQRFDLVNAVRVPSSVANYALPAAGVVAGWGLVPIVALLLAARVATAAAFLWAAVRAEPRAKVMPRIHAGYLQPMLVFGGWVTLGMILTPFLTYADRIFLAGLADAGAVGYYVPPAEVVMRMLIIPASLVATLFPALSAMSAVKRPTETAIWQGMKYVTLLVAVPVAGVIAVGEPGLVLWLGEEFGRAAAPVLPVLAVGVAVLSPAYLPHVALQATGRADIPTRLYIMEIPIFVALLLVLVPAWGVVGAAVAWTARVAIDAALQTLAAARVGLITAHGGRAARVPQALGAAALAVAGGFAAAAVPGVWASGATLAGALGVSAAVVWRLALDRGERASIRGWLSLRPSVEGAR
jgi:O-antigen/teichoic acid export membrane protein